MRRNSFVVFCTPPPVAANNYSSHIRRIFLALALLDLMLSGFFSVYPAQQSHVAMYSPLQRLFAIGSYIMTCASVALPLIALTSHFLTVQPVPTDISFQLNDVNLYNCSATSYHFSLSAL